MNTQNLKLRKCLHIAFNVHALSLNRTAYHLPSKVQEAATS